MVNSDFYQCSHSQSAVKVFQWWRGILLAVRPRRICHRTSTPQRIIYTDADKKTGIAGSVTFGPSNCIPVPAVEACRPMTADQDWNDLFAKANLICGLEMLAIAQEAADPDHDLCGQCVTFYIDNNNAMSDPIRGASKAVIISALTRIFWAIFGRMGITTLVWESSDGFQHRVSPYSDY